MGTRRSLMIVADSLEGGLGAVARAHAAWFSNEGWHVVVAAPASGAAVRADFVAVPVPRSARDVISMGRAATRLRSVSRRVQPSVVHCHGARSFLATRVAGIRPFVTLHGAGAVSSDPVGYARLRRSALRLVPRLAAGAVSAVPGVPGWRFLPHASPRLASLARTPFPAPETRPTFLWVGRVDEGKPGDEFVQAVARVARTRDVVGLIVGGGPGITRLEGLAAELNAPVEFLGEGDPEPLLRRAWVLGLFSKHEALSFVVQEAMWVGRAVVVSPLPGLEWLVGDAGVFAADVDGAAAAMASLCDPAKAGSLGERAAERVRRLIAPDDPWPAISAMYDEQCVS